MYNRKLYNIYTMYTRYIFHTTHTHIYTIKRSGKYKYKKIEQYTKFHLHYILCKPTFIV